MNCLIPVRGSRLKDAGFKKEDDPRNHLKELNRRNNTPKMCNGCIYSRKVDDCLALSNARSKI